MKVLILVTPWAVVAIAAVIFAFVYPAQEADESLRYYEIKKSLIAMLLAAILYRFGSGIAEGMDEAMKQPPSSGTRCPGCPWPTPRCI